MGRRVRVGYVTAEEFAEWCGVSRRTVWRWLRNGLIPGQRIVRSWWVRVPRPDPADHHGAELAATYAHGLAETRNGVSVPPEPHELAPTFPGSTVRRRRRPELGPDFEAFWRAYPRRVGKGAAARAWLAIQPDEALLARMLEALEWQRGQAQWLKDGGAFVPHPATWLNQCRWEDEPVELPQMSERTVRNLQAVAESLRRHPTPRKEIE